jgi:hypothetical protein
MVDEKKRLLDDINLGFTMRIAYGAARKEYNEEIRDMEKYDENPLLMKEQWNQIFSPDCGGLGFVDIYGIGRNTRLHRIFKEFCEDNKMCRLFDEEYHFEGCTDDISVHLILEDFSSKFHQCINPRLRANERFINILKKHQENFQSIDKDTKNLMAVSRLD